MQFSFLNIKKIKGDKILKKIFSFLLIVVLTIGVFGCSSQNQTSGSEEGASENSEASSGNPFNGKVLTILTGGTSGVYFPLGNALAKIYNNTGAQASVETTGASAVNASKIARKKAEIGFAMADTVSDAYNGVDNFEKTGALKNLRAVTALYSNYMQIVAPKSSGINSIEDLKGKKVAVGAPGSGTEIMAKRVLEAAGLTYDDIEEDFLSFQEGVDGIKNGVIDAAILSSGIPNAGIMELATTEDIIIVNIPKDIVEKLQEAYPAFVSITIPSGTYEGQTEDIETAGVKNLLITHADMSDEEVYELTKQIYEQIKVLRDTHSAAEDIILEEATTGLPLPLHPGAEKYFKEQGVLK